MWADECEKGCDFWDWGAFYIRRIHFLGSDFFLPDTDSVPGTGVVGGTSVWDGSAGA